MKSVKIFSLPRSGSNYLKAFLEKNLEVEVIQNKKIWKHALADCKTLNKSFTKIITVWKDPYSWLVSMYKISKNPNWKSVKQTKKNFSEFIRTSFYFDAEDGKEKQSYSNPLEMYNKYCDHYFKLQNELSDFYIFNFNELIVHQRIHIDVFSKEAGIKKRGFCKIKKVALPSGEKINFGKNNFDISFYSEKKYMKIYSKEDIDFVKANLTENYSKLRYLL